MNHGMAYLHACGKRIEDEPSRLLLQDLNQFLIGGEILFIAKDGCGEMPIQSASCLQIVLCVVASHQHRVGSKDLIGQLWFGEKFLEFSSKQLRIHRACMIRVGPGCRGCVRRRRSTLLGRAAIFTRNTWSEKRVRLSLVDELAQFNLKVGGFGALRYQHDAGLGAELTRAEGERSKQGRQPGLQDLCAKRRAAQTLDCRSTSP